MCPHSPFLRVIPVRFSSYSFSDNRTASDTLGDVNLKEKKGGRSMKYFWYVIAVVNTCLFAVFIFGLWNGKLTINTSSYINGSIETNIADIPTVHVRQY